jgi:2-alkyl-3-oxoalkanoate reductase
MDMSEMKIGIVGCGLIADTHVEALKECLPGAEIFVCDPAVGKAELMKKQHELRGSFGTLEEMIQKEGLNAVHILSPPQYHVRQALQCLEAGCHVLVEKPLAFKADEIDELYERARKCGRDLCVDHSLLLQPSVSRMLDRIRAGDSGEVLHVNSFYGIDTGGASSLAPGGHWKHELPGGAIVDTIIHPVTLAVELAGRPLDLSAHVMCPEEEPGEAFISWKGQKATVSICVSAHAQPSRRVTEVTCTKETFIVDHSTETLVRLHAGFGPRGLSKLMRNLGYGSQLIKGTIGTVIDVARGRLKGNPGARALIRGFYGHLGGQGDLPVTEANVKDSTCALQMIVERMGNERRSPASVLSGHPAQEAPVKRAEGLPKIVLVTGASGFLGSKIVEVLGQKGVTVKAQVRRSVNADKLNMPNIAKIFEDFNYDPVVYGRLIEDVDAVVHSAHAAGATKWEQYKKTNVDASLALYDAAAKSNVSRFIFLSSVAVYGVSQKGYLKVDENTPTTLGMSKWDFYIKSKSLAEEALLERARRGGPKLLIIRPGILYGRDGMRLARRALPLKESKMLIGFGKGKNHTPFTRVDVLSEAICNVLAREPFPEGVYNLTGNPEEGTEKFIYNRMGRLGVKCRFLHLPAFLFRAFAGVLETAHSLAGSKSPPKITRYIIDSSTRDIYYDCSKAERDLGWSQKAAIEP